MDEFERTLLTENYLAALTSAPRHESYEVSPKDHDLATDVLVNIMYEVTNQAKVRDDWESVTAFEKTGSWPHTFRKTKKTALEVSLTIDLRGVFFECDFRHGYMLPSVDDRFWRRFANLVLDYGGKYELRQWPREFASAPGEREISRARKSAVFSMVADFIFVTKVSDRDPPIGDLTFRFEWEGKWSRIIPQLVEITAEAWQMSYLLYRAAYQRRKDLEKRVKRRLQRGD
ncbi:MAG TPA: hypothetical protein VJ749_08155 [Pyrinomonadaceae bacterium]|nr:hypothetical protein [Pyrinomonadaceae bacterium]